MDEIDERWPENFGQVGGMTFQEAFEKEKKLVAVTLNGMSAATGIFKLWFDFCHKKAKEHEQAPTIGDGENKGGNKQG